MRDCKARGFLLQGARWLSRRVVLAESVCPSPAQLEEHPYPPSSFFLHFFSLCSALCKCLPLCGAHLCIPLVYAQCYSVLLLVAVPLYGTSTKAPGMGCVTLECQIASNKPGGEHWRMRARELLEPPNHGHEHACVSYLRSLHLRRTNTAGSPCRGRAGRSLLAAGLARHVPLCCAAPPADEAVMTEESIAHVADLFSRHGSDIWWTAPLEQLLPPSLAHLAPK